MRWPGGLRRRLVRAMAAGVLATAAVLLGAGPAAAHAVLLRATPGFAAVVSSSPRVVQLDFSEAVEARPDSVEVLGPDGRRLPASAHGNPRSATSVLVALPRPLGAGTYTVRWHLIARDGHPSVGDYRFAVRAPSAPLGSASQADGGPTLLGGTGRALSAGGALALVGLSLFPVLVLGPARRRLAPQVATAVTSDVVRRLRLPSCVAAAIACAGTLLVLADITAVGSGATAVAGLLRPDRLLTTAAATRTGTLLLVRLAAVAATVGLLTMLARRHRQARPVRAPGCAAVGAVVVLVLTFALSSHAATEADETVAVLLDALHLLAAGVWAGGLLGLGLAGLPAARRTGHLGPDAPADAAGALAGRFSLLAQTAMAALLATGAYAALIRVTALGDLSTGWGRDLVVKLALWVTVLVVASGNALLVVPAIADRARTRAQRRAASGQLASSVRLELGLAAGLVVVAGLLSATAPPAQSRPAPTVAAPAVTKAAGNAGGYRIDVQAVRSGRGPTVATVFGFSLTTEGTAASAPAASATLTGRDGVARGLDLDLVDEGQWTSGALAVPPGRYEMAVQVDRASGVVRIPVTVRVG